MAPASRFEINYGLMLLSRKALTDTRASGFNSQSQFRGYLEASVRPLIDLRDFVPSPHTLSHVFVSYMNAFDVETLGDGCR